MKDSGSSSKAVGVGGGGWVGGWDRVDHPPAFRTLVSLCLPTPAL